MKKVKAEKQIEEITITCDLRENASSVALELNNLSSDKLKVNTILEKLEIGDYKITEDVIIERKTISDLEASIIDGR
ncbi:MAG: ERCC4 domain-containing protein, partial [archaeon]